METGESKQEQLQVEGKLIWITQLALLQNHSYKFNFIVLFYITVTPLSVFSFTTDVFKTSHVH